MYRLQVDNSRTVLLKIATLYAERLMNDICLVVDGVEYPAHRLILCASSDVFQVRLNLYIFAINTSTALSSISGSRIMIIHVQISLAVKAQSIAIQLLKQNA